VAERPAIAGSEDQGARIVVELLAPADVGGIAFVAGPYLAGEMYTLFDRLEWYPAIKPLKRPGSRPYANFSTHDPGGQIFDVAHTDPKARIGVYAEEGSPTIQITIYRTGASP
jgi:hypothetical protein